MKNPTVNKVSCGMTTHNEVLCQGQDTNSFALDRELTVVMAFLNERDEVANTVKSIRNTVGFRVEIIAVNDNSDCDYDYEGDIKDLDVEYIRNNSRLGAALSKQRGVELVKTPYFLLIDAHMRFYSVDWDIRLLSLLRQNPERLLCTQTLGLSKTPDGDVIVTDSHGHAYGAYISYDCDRYIPDTEWNTIPVETSQDDIMPVPCVLGAGYASSKSYWTKIKGMEGLIHYGCEEPYISIKAWREGGGCYLVPNIAIGHIYRQTFPYSVSSIERIYNHLMIAETLFTDADRAYAHAVAWRHGKYTYLEAKALLAKNACTLHHLRDTYSQWTALAYEDIKSMNIRFARHLQTDTVDNDRLSLLTKQIMATPANGIDAGIIYGKTLFLVYLLSYVSNGHDDPSLTDIIQHLWESIKCETCRSSAPFFFRDGLAGIGWGLIYMCSYNLIEDDLDNELAYIDMALSQLSPKRVHDLDFINGIGGIYAYVSARIAFCARTSTANNFDPLFIEELTQHADKVKTATNDWRTYYHVLRFLDTIQSAQASSLPGIYEISSVNHATAAAPNNWRLELNDIIGIAISTLNE